MPKQGKYAKASSLKRIRNIKRKQQAHHDHAIDRADLSDFLVVRYQLVTEKQAEIAHETLQRFLMLWLETAEKHEGEWSVRNVTKQALQSANIQVPWQFYAFIVGQWNQFQKFLLKEIPAVPLDQQQIVTDPLTSAEVSRMVAQQLAANVFLTTFKGDDDRLQAVAAVQMMQMTASFLRDQQVDWQAVTAVFLATPFAVAPDVDSGTRDWLVNLSQYSAAQLNV
ncbi:hypothetical protein [Levilactobacillus bambusae]|uniref:Uncharacterized protein n=1 Tax=Levilactobacillus bambusae TaxID=2024736 RepID=A0A2V1N0M9_9LACO|nr:hypothetical protein [Levilactobacillus bambusae]PWG00298.1 hypothetical protein DCM90_05035 [Levilactobacillus bambusae]